MNGWHWYDTVIVIGCWSLPLFAIGMKLYFDWKWQKKFGERKP